MERYSIVHTAIVKKTDGRTATVTLDLGDRSKDCGGCALVAVCRKDSGDGDSSRKAENLDVEAGIPDSLKASTAVGARVRVGAVRHSTLNATVHLLLMPMLVFLLVAVAGTLLRIEEGLVGVLALLAAGMCYFFLYVFGKRRGRKPMWVIIP